MAIASVLLGAFSLLGYVIFILNRGSSSAIFFAAVALGLLAAIFGLIAKGQPRAKIGMILGVIDVVIGVVLVLWLLPMNA
jgi:uncharacterized membrane protein YjjB (DUF3815 family)